MRWTDDPTAIDEEGKDSAFDREGKDVNYTAEIKALRDSAAGVITNCESDKPGSDTKGTSSEVVMIGEGHRRCSM